MCARFNKAFKKDNATIPKTIIEQLDNELFPDEFEYINYEDACVLSLESIKNFINENSFELPQNLVGKSINQILAYSYNSQEKLKIKEKVEVNIRPFETKIILRHTLNDEEPEIKFTISPPKFKEFDIEIEGNGVYKTVTIKRHPSKDLNIIIFKRINYQDLEIACNINLENSKSNFRVKVNFEQCKSVNDALNNLKLLRAFADKTLNVNGKPIDEVLDDFQFPIDIDSLDYVINFYEKLNEVSKLINIKIKPKEEVLPDDIYNTEILYKCLIEKKPYKEYIEINNLSMTVGKELDIDKIFNNDKFVFKTFEDTEVEILNTKIPLYSILTMYNLIITGETHVKTNEGINYKLECSNSSKKKTYKSCMYFVDEKSRSEYINNHEDINKIFEKAGEFII